MAYRRQGKLNQAITLFDEGRSRVPFRHLSYTINIAVLHKLAGRDEEAVAEQGRIDDSLHAFDRYLQATSGMTGNGVEESRALAVAMIRRLKDSSR